MDEPFIPNQNRLSADAISHSSAFPLLYQQQKKEPWIFPVLRWVFILFALALLGFVFTVFGHIAKDYLKGGSGFGRQLVDNSTLSG